MSDSITLQYNLLFISKIYYSIHLLVVNCSKLKRYLLHNMIIFNTKMIQIEIIFILIDHHEYNI